MRKWIIRFLVIALLGGAIFALRAYQQEPLYQSQSYVFGTLVDISIYGETDKRAAILANQVLQDFQQLHQQLHAWKNDPQGKPGELGKLNQAFAQSKTPVPISPELTQMLQDAQNLSAQSQGLFNPAIGYLISYWGFQKDEFGTSEIDDEKISLLVKAKPSMADIVLHNQTAYSNNSQVKLDLGGYAKGYALDMAAGYLRAQHVKNALINIGGNIIAIGQHGDKPWRVGIQNPRSPGAIATLNLNDGWAIGTSGDYQRYFILNGKRYCHIIDPRNGYPVQHTQAVTVLIPPQPHAGALSDVASKPIFIAAESDKVKAAANLGISHFLVIDANSNVLITQAMAEKLNWSDTNFQKNHHVRIIHSH
jgi:thiamine biosynthesis lipoprotein